MNTWLETFPHKVYASVLVLDGKAVDYKIGQNYWENSSHVTLRGQITFEELKRCETRYTFWEVNSQEEHEEIFEKIAVKWIENQSI